MPVKGPDRRFMALVAYLGGRFNVCGEKWYGSNIANRDRGLPRSILTTLLNDPDTGAPIAFLSANALSSTRTGAIPAVGAKYFAKNNIKSFERDRRRCDRPGLCGRADGGTEAGGGNPDL